MLEALSVSGIFFSSISFGKAYARTKWQSRVRYILRNYEVTHNFKTVLIECNSTYHLKINKIISKWGGTVSIYEVLSRNAAAVALRLSSLSEDNEKGTFELPIDLYDDKQLSSLVSKDTELEIDYDVFEVSKSGDSYDVNFDLKLKKTESKYSSISLIFKFHGFNDENFIMIPSHFYGRAKDADNLSEDNEKGKSIDAKDGITSGMGFYNPVKKQAFFICFKEHTLKSCEKIGFREAQDAKLCEFYLSIPIEVMEACTDSKDISIPIGIKVLFAPCKDIGTFYNTCFNFNQGLHKETKPDSNMSMSYRSDRYNDSADIENVQVNMLQSAVRTLQSILMGNRDVLTTYSEDLDTMITKVLLNDVSLETEGTRNDTDPVYRIEDLETSYFISKCLLYLYHEDNRLIKDEWNSAFNEFGQKLVRFADGEVNPYIDKKLEADFNKNMFCLSVGVFPAVLGYWGHFLKNSSMVKKAEEVAEKLYRLTFDGKNHYNGIYNIKWGYMLTESFITLYEATGKKEWLDKGIAAASFLSTFSTELEQGVPQEFSGNALFRLFLYTMDFRYINLLKNILNTSKEKGCSKNLGLLTYLEIPGIYINPSEGMIATVDNIDAKVLDWRNEKLRIVITNRTDFSAKVRTLADRSSSMNSEYGFNIPPLGEIYLAPGDTRVLSF